MSYNTSYSLKVDNGFSWIIGELKSFSEEADYCIDTDGKINNSGRWYEHEDDLKSFSSKYPNVLFTLNGEGENNEDIWIKYFKAGKMQVCKAIITFEPFNELLLT